MTKRTEVRKWAKAKFGIQQKFNDFLLWCYQKKTPLAIMAVGLLAVFFMLAFLKQLFLIAFFIAIGSASLLYNRVIRTSIGVELITLGVIIIGKLYGPLAAMIVGFVSLLLAELFNGSLQHKTLVSFVGILAIGFLTQFFASTNITTEGMVLVIIYNAIIMPGYLLLGSSLIRSGLFLVTHIIFSFWIFSTIAPALYGFLT